MTVRTSRLTAVSISERIGSRTAPKAMSRRLTIVMSALAPFCSRPKSSRPSIFAPPRVIALNTSRGMAGEKTLVGDSRSERRVAHVGENIFGKSVRADAHVDAGFAITVEGFHDDAELQIFERAVGHRRAGVGDDFQIVAVGIGEPAMAADEDAVRERHFRIEKADLFEQLDGRAAFALHDRVKFERD